MNFPTTQGIKTPPSTSGIGPSGFVLKMVLHSENRHEKTAVFPANRRSRTAQSCSPGSFRFCFGGTAGIYSSSVAVPYPPSPAHFIIKWRCVAPAAAKFIFLNSEHNAIHAKFNCKTAPFPGLGPANIYNVAEPADTRCMIQILLLGRLRSSLEYPYI